MRSKDGRGLTNTEIAAMDSAGELERLINEKLMRLYQEAAVRDELAAMDAYNAALEAVEQSCESLKQQRGW
jgi:hypothetical protein